MSARNINIIDLDGRIAAITRAATGTTWSVTCIVIGDQCPAITGIGNRTQAIAAAEKHLHWHAIGKPVCEKCGAQVGQRGQKRCRPGTCQTSEVARG